MRGPRCLVAVALLLIVLPINPAFAAAAPNSGADQQTAVEASVPTVSDLGQIQRQARLFWLATEPDPALGQHDRADSHADHGEHPEAMTATTAVDGANAIPLSQAQVAGPLAQAMAEWQTSGVSATIADLPDGTLAQSSGTTIVVDPLAAGHGWDVVGGSMSLLTVLRHEVGHALGHQHGSSPLMDSHLAPGESHSVPAPVTEEPEPIAEEPSTDTSESASTESANTEPQVTSTETSIVETESSEPTADATTSDANETTATTDDSTLQSSEPDSTDAEVTATQSDPATSDAEAGDKTTETTESTTTDDASSTTKPSNVTWTVDGGVATANLSEGVLNHTLRLNSATNSIELAGSDGTSSVTSLESVTAIVVLGGAGDDNLVVDTSGGSFPVPVSFDGGAGNDTVSGPAINTEWNITSVGGGDVAGVSFSAVETVSGAAGNEDTFVIGRGASVATVLGGDGGYDLMRVVGDVFESTPTGPHSGTIVLDGAVITYDGLEPVDATAADVTINGTGAPDLLKVAPFVDASCTDGGGCVQVQFRDPTDSFDTGEFHWFGVTGLNSVTINGGDLYDEIVFNDSINLGSASLTVAGERIIVNGSITTSGDVTLGATHTVSGGTGSGLGDCLQATVHGDFVLGTHCAAAEVLVSGGSVSGAAVSLTANSSVTPDSADVIVPNSKATVSITGPASVTGSGNVALNATSHVGFTITEEGLADTAVSATVFSAAAVLIADAATVIAGGTLDIDSTSTVDDGSGAAAVVDVTGASGSSNSDQDAAIAVVIVASDAIADITGTSNLTATGALTIDAINDVDVEAKADTDDAAAGAGLVTLIVLPTTRTAIETAGTITAASLTVNATADNRAASSAIARNGGASSNSSGTPNDNTTAPGASGGNANTSGGSMDVAAALAFTYLGATTQAYASPASGILTLTTPGAIQQFRTTARNRATANADGTDVGSNNNGAVGVALAVVVANITNSSRIGGNVNSTGTEINAEIGRPPSGADQFESTATSGVGDSSGLTVAGSLAVIVVISRTTAEVAPGAVLTLSPGTDLTLDANDDIDATTKAIPGEDIGTGQSTGIGASIALAIIDSITTAAIGNGASIGGAGDVVLTATTKSDAITEARNGVKGGTAIAPVIGITVSMVDTDTLVDAGSLLTAGSLAATATQTASAATTAAGEIEEATNAAVGISLAFTWVEHSVTSALKRDLMTTTGGVTLAALGSSTTSSTATASATGAEDTGQTADQQSAGQRTLADGQAANNGTRTTDSTTSTPNANSNQSGSISVAAAFAINVTNTTSSATTADGTTVNSADAVTVRSTANTQATSSADGSSVTHGSGTAVGIAVSINLGNVTNSATVNGTVVAPSLTIEAIMTNLTGDTVHTFSSTARSGASGSGVSVAVSLAIAISNLLTEAQVGPNASISATSGDVALTSASNGETTTSAIPLEDAKGGSVGVGGSVALGLITDNGLAQIPIGSNLAVLAGDLAVVATGGHSSNTNAKAGAGSTGVTVTPAVALTISNVTRRGQILGDNTSAILALTGALQIAGRAPPSENKVITKAEGSAESTGSAAIGITAALSFVNHDYIATLDRNVDAGGNVLIEGIGRTRIETDSKANAEGASSNNNGQNVNQQVGSERSGADSQAAANGGSGSGSTSTPSASTSSGPVAVAAAITVAVVTTNSLATIAAGRTITADGPLTVRSSANSDSIALANGKAKTKGGSAGIAAAVVVNWLEVTNKATVGASTVMANGVNIEALMTESGRDQVLRWDDDKDEWVLVEAGEKLPEITLWQYNKPADTSKDAKWEEVPKGATLPTDTSGLENGDAFQLTAQDGTNAPGVYTWNGSAWTAFGGTIDQDSKFPEGTLGLEILNTSSDNDLFKLDPADNAFFNLTKQDGSNAPGVYKWNGGTNTWVLQTAAASITSGATLPASPAANALFRLREHEATAETLAGAGSSDVGIGGAVSINIVTITTEATAPAGATVNAGTGNSNIEAQSNNRSKSIGSANAKGGSVGVGIALGLNVLTLTTTAEIADGVGYTPTGGLNVIATVHQAAVAEAMAGSASSSGVAVSPAVGLTILTADTTARIGTGAAIVGSGAVAVRATYDGTSAVKADAKAGGKSVAVGAGIAINVVTPTTVAEIARSVTGTSVDIDATTSAITSADSTAGAKGAKNTGGNDGSGNNTADAQSQGEVSNNPNTSGTGTTLPSAQNSTSQGSSTSSSQSGQGGSGVGVAAAIVVNVVTLNNKALVTGAVTITGTTGAVGVEAVQHTDGRAKAIGTSLVSSASANVGVAVGVNVVTVHNLATVSGGATLDGHGLSLKAITAEDERNDFVVWGLAASGGTSSKVSVAGSVGVQVITVDNIASTGAGVTLNANGGGIDGAASTPIGLQTLALSGGIRQDRGWCGRGGQHRQPHYQGRHRQQRRHRRRRCDQPRRRNLDRHSRHLR